MHCLKAHVLAAPYKQINVHAPFQFASNQTILYIFFMFWAVSFSGTSTNHWATIPSAHFH